MCATLTQSWANLGLVIKCAVVTGAAAGIGAATVRRLVAGGYEVVAVDVAPVDDVDHVHPVIGDVSSEDTWRSVVDTVPAPITAFVSNAFARTVAPLHEQDRAAWDRQLAVEYALAVRVNTVLPGPVLTAAWDQVSEAAR